MMTMQQLLWMKRKTHNRHKQPNMGIQTPVSVFFLLLIFQNSTSIPIARCSNRKPITFSPSHFSPPFLSFLLSPLLLLSFSFSCETRGDLHGSAADKREMFVQRLREVHQRLLRHRLFIKPVLPYGYQHEAETAAASNGEKYYDLTSLESLVGEGHSNYNQRLNNQGGAGGKKTNNITNKTRCVMGLLSQLQEGKYFLEGKSFSSPLFCYSSLFFFPFSSSPLFSPLHFSSLLLFSPPPLLFFSPIHFFFFFFFLQIFTEEWL
jgi:hypothetical protein